MPRAIWSGSISFGLVAIPVKLIPAIHEKTIHFQLLSPEGNCKLRQKLYCPDTGQEYELKDAVRGYEIAPSQYVIVSDEELERLKPESARRIEITAFVDLQAIDPIYYDRAYYLVPEEAAARAYALLFEAMRRSGRVAVARFVMRQREYLAALRPQGQGLLLQTMIYADEVVPQENLVGLPDTAALSPQEIETAQRIIHALAGEFDPSQYQDACRQKIEQFVKIKVEGGDVSRLMAAEAAPEPQVINLMDALQQSLEQAEKEAPSVHRRKSA